MYKILYFLPKNYLSYLMGYLLHIVFPKPIRLWLMGWFVNAYKINMEEAEYPLDRYTSIGNLFVRRLKPGIRPIRSDLVHPVDAVISQMGLIQNQTLIQAKGKSYVVNDLLQKDKKMDFEGGMFLTYYLCPTDYHRIHSPVSGFITSSSLIPGKLWPVNTWSVETIKNLFSVNERVVTYIQAQAGKVAVVKVGATNVGKITLAYDPAVVSNQCSSKTSHKDYTPPHMVQAGDELGAFHMGSTVVLLVDKNIAKRIQKTKCGPVRMGESLD